MSVTQFDYKALRVGATDIGVPVGGQIVMDETWSPHIQATFSVPYTDAAYAACDPRLGASKPPYVNFSVTATRPGLPAQGLGLDLRLTGRSRDRAREVLTITAASAEWLSQLTKNVTSTPDESLLQWQTSDELVRMGLLWAKGLGSSTFPWLSRPLPVLVDAENLIPNPSFSAGINGWQAIAVTATVTSGQLVLSAPSSAGAYAYCGPALGSGQVFPGVVEGKTYTLSAKITLSGALGGTPDAFARRLLVAFRRGTVIFPNALSTQAPNAAGSTRLSVTFTVPVGVTDVGFRAYHGHPSGTVTWDEFVLTETVPGDATSGTYWDGDTPDTAQYSYEWDTAAGLSTSKRFALVERSPDAFIVQPGESYWDKVSGLVQSVGLRIFADGSQAWRLIDDTYVAPGGSRFMWDDLLEWSDSLSLDDQTDEWCDAAVVRYYWRDWQGIDRERFDAYATSATPRKTHTTEINAPYPGPGLARNIVNRSAAYGDSVTFSAVADLTVRPTQPVSVSMPSGLLVAALVRRVRFDLDTDTMTVETRGVTTPPADSWDALPTGQRWIDSPIGATWEGEAIG